MDLKNTQLLRFTTAGSVDDGKSTSLADYFTIVSLFFKINSKL